jgi:hypothetical protein
MRVGSFDRNGKLNLYASAVQTFIKKSRPAALCGADERSCAARRLKVNDPHLEDTAL